MKFSAVLAGFVLAVSTTFASAHVLQYAAQLDGPSESPPNASLGFGNALVTIDTDLATMRVIVGFGGLDGNVTAAHIHCCIAPAPPPALAGVATVTPSFTGFPLGGTSGIYDHTFDLAAPTPTDTYNQAFINANGGTESGAMNALLLGLGAGKAYLNIHTSSFIGGEIRGFLQAVPEPETYALFLAGLGLLAVAARRRMSA